MDWQNNMDNIISLDLGKGGGRAYWKAAKKKKYIPYDIEGWDIGKYDFSSEGLYAIVMSVYNYVKESRPIIIVEKPGRHLPYQWILYSDVKEIANQFKVPYFEYHPMTIKKIVTGNGKAGKEEIQKVLGELIPELSGFELATEHMWDSVATGACHLKKVGML